jgi:hypothetical protein
MDSEYLRRKVLTFAQAEGLAPLPAQLAKTELSPSLRARLWNVLHSSLLAARVSSTQRLSTPWAQILKDKHIKFDGRMGRRV